MIDWIQSKDILTIVPTRFRLRLTFREKTYRGVLIVLRYSVIKIYEIVNWQVSTLEMFLVFHELMKEIHFQW